MKKEKKVPSVPYRYACRRTGKQANRRAGTPRRRVGLLVLLLCTRHNNAGNDRSLSGRGRCCGPGGLVPTDQACSKVEKADCCVTNNTWIVAPRSRALFHTRQPMAAGLADGLAG